MAIPFDVTRNQDVAPGEGEAAEINKEPTNLLQSTNYDSADVKDDDASATSTGKIGRRTSALKNKRKEKSSSKKCFRWHRDGRHRKRWRFLKRNSGAVHQKSLKNASEFANDAQLCDGLLSSPLETERKNGRSTEDMFQGDSDTDTIPLELEGLTNIDISVPKPETDRGADDSFADARASSTRHGLLGCVKNLSPAFGSLSSDLEVPQTGAESCTVSLKLENVCDDSIDDLEIIDLDDIEVDDVLTVDLSDQERETEDAKKEVADVKTLQPDSELKQMECTTDMSTAFQNCNDTSDISRETENDATETGSLWDEKAAVSELPSSLGKPVDVDGRIAVGGAIKCEDVDNARAFHFDVKIDADGLSGSTTGRDAENKDALRAVEKWERTNIFENLCASCPLGHRGRDVALNFENHFSIQKASLESSAEFDEDKVGSGDAAYVESIKRTIHDHCIEAEDKEEKLVDDSNKNSIECVHSKAKASENGPSLRELQEEACISDRSDGEAGEHLPDSSDWFKSCDLVENINYCSEPAPPGRSRDADVFRRNNAETGTPDEASARKSSRRYSTRVAKRISQLAKKSASNHSNISKNKNKKLVRLQGQKGGEAKVIPSPEGDPAKCPISTVIDSANLLNISTIIDSANLLNISNVIDSANLMNIERTLETNVQSDPCLPGKFTTDMESDVRPAFPLVDASNKSSKKSSTSSFKRKSWHKMNLKSSWNVNAGIHLTSLYQPYVSIVPLPLEGLTRLAMRNNSESDSLREDQVEESEETTACTPAMADNSELGDVCMMQEVTKSSDHRKEVAAVEVGDPEAVAKDDATTNIGEEILCSNKKKASFLEALEMPSSLSVKRGHRNRRRVLVEKKMSSCREVSDATPCNDDTSDVNKSPKKESSNYFSSLSKKKSITSDETHSMSARSRADLKRLPSNEKRNALLPLKSSCKSTEKPKQKAQTRSMEAVFPLMDRSSVMSLPKIKKLSDANSNGLPPTKSLESYGVLEKVERAMAEESCLKFSTQNSNKLLSSQNPSNKFKPNLSSDSNLGAVSPKAPEAPSSSPNALVNHWPNPKVSHSNMPPAEDGISITNHQSGSSISRESQWKCHEVQRNRPDNKSSNARAAGLDLLWMRNNRSHDPLGLEDPCFSDDEKSTMDKNKNDGRARKDDEREPGGEIDRRNDGDGSRLRFVESKSDFDAKLQAWENELQRGQESEELLLNKLGDELKDLEVIVKVQQRIAHEPSENLPDGTKACGRAGIQNFYESYKKPPLWRSDVCRQRTGCSSSAVESHAHNRRKHFHNKNDNRRSNQFYQSRRTKACPVSNPTNLSSLFQTPSSSSSEGGSCQHVDYPEGGESRARMQEVGYSNPVPNGNCVPRHPALDPHRNFSGQNEFWRSNCNSHRWPPSRKFYRNAPFGSACGARREGDPSFFGRKRSKEMIHHDHDGVGYYGWFPSNDVTPKSCAGDRLNVSERNSVEEAHKQPAVLSSVESKVGKYLKRGHITADDYRKVVGEITKKLQLIESRRSSASKSRTNDENEEGECEDSDDAVDSDLDYMIEQYLREFQTHGAPQYYSKHQH